MPACEHKAESCANYEFEIITDATDYIDMHANVSPIDLETYLYMGFDGIVKDHETCVPIPDVLLRFTNGQYSCLTRTNSCGAFHIIFPRCWKNVSVEITKKGYLKRYIGLLFCDKCPQEFLLHRNEASC